MTQNRDTLIWAGFALASLMLAFEPITWLIHSWHDPAYQSNGGLYGLALTGLVALSLVSTPATERTSTGRVFVPFLAAAVVRLLGQVLAINILSALALAVDMYAIALFLGLDRRRLAISPFWLAVFFLFALPLGPILQRVAGYPLQMVSAQVACHMLSYAFADLTCEGVRLRVDGIDVLVDLPCSGASGLLVMVSLWAFLNVIYRPGFMHAGLGVVIITLFALFGNALRISLLAGGLALGFDTMSGLLHTVIGMMTLGMSAGIALIFYRPKPAPVRGDAGSWDLPKWTKAPIAVCAMLIALVIINLPKTPVDVSAPVQKATLPSQLNGKRAFSIALSPIEEIYFTAYGGAAQKVQYGPLGVNLVHTSSPLRHLHAPETCLRGLGFQVHFKGTTFDPIPTSIYEATGPDGRVWHVAVSFVSDNGYVTAGVGEAVWHWLRGASGTWKSVQRITPVTLQETERRSYELAIFAALDLT
ncbi:MAG: exosortase T [Pseudomonadota bacterium]